MRKPPTRVFAVLLAVSLAGVMGLGQLLGSAQASPAMTRGAIQEPTDDEVEKAAIPALAAYVTAFAAATGAREATYVARLGRILPDVWVAGSAPEQGAEHNGLKLETIFDR